MTVLIFTARAALPAAFEMYPFNVYVEKCAREICKAQQNVPGQSRI